MKFKKMLIIGIDKHKLESEYWEKISSLAEQVVNVSKNSPEIDKHISGVDCLLLDFGIEIDKKFIENASELKYIGILATAYDKVDISFANKKGIVVCNIPGYSTESVAEFVFAAILEHIRELEKAKKQAREGNYSEVGFSAIELKNKIYGVFGAGRIGSRVAEIALGFGMNVRYWSRNRKKELETKGIKYEDSDTLIPKCDFISAHFAKTEETKDFFNAKRIQEIKKEAIIVNTISMETYDISALEKRLKNGDITFIFETDDINENIKRLLKYKNCIAYPSIAYVSKEARIAKQEIFIKNIENFLKGSPINKVN